MSYRMVKTACRYDMPFQRYVFGGKHSEQSASNVRAKLSACALLADNGRELGSYTNGLASDQSRTSFASTVPYATGQPARFLVV